MNKDFYAGNRRRLYEQMKPGSLLVLFSVLEFSKTKEEFYPFYSNRNLIYLTNLDQKSPP